MQSLVLRRRRLLHATPHEVRQRCGREASLLLRPRCGWHGMPHCLVLVDGLLCLGSGLPSRLLGAFLALALGKRRVNEASIIGGRRYHLRPLRLLLLLLLLAKHGCH